MQIEITNDGSSTLYVPELEEHYHSVKGALTESKHIFIEMGLHHATTPNPHILEIGFGTGLNAFLTLLDADKNQRKIRYTGIERYPLSTECLHSLNYPSLICPERADDYYRMHESAWDSPVEITPYFELLKQKADFTQMELPYGFDLVYFDAFAPEKQPEMWNQKLFDNLYNSLNPGGILTTYCAKGVVRRMLQTAGFHVERLPGPPQGKREILRATRI